MVALVGTAMACLALIAWALLAGDAATPWVLAGGALYVAGAIGVTAARNVPMNDALDAADVPTDPNEAAKLWADYSERWTRWNTLRAAFSTLSLLLVGLAIFAWGREW
jgi:uncharacterized membrane protein